MWTGRESNPRLRNANAVYYHCTIGPLWLFYTSENLERYNLRPANPHHYLLGKPLLSAYPKRKLALYPPDIH
ncbi:MAG: hypothetical protein UX62_C0012G0008 [Microgenomates group bacterium GW2011_GWA2_46_7]|nr:MAG: hypothetical protein UX62_C0012G0008 [Microgenomates group bacterium GW2011_GWA2_46_7]